MNATPAQLAIARLIELAETGEIDPWDVQVIDVIDRFLTQLPAKTDLAESGQAFLWASMLVLLKANSLEAAQLDPTDSSPEATTALESRENLSREVIPLEKHLRRRTSAPPLRQRRVTLAELITQIQELEAKFQEKPRVKRSHSAKKAQAQAITELAHRENLTEIAQALATFLQQLESKAWHLDELLSILSEAQTTVQYDRVGVFWALLLLSAESKVELQQEEFYQDLRITPLK